MTTGVSAPRKPVLEDDAALGHALRSSRADVVLAHRLDQVAADHPRVERRGRHRERDPGQDELALRDRLPDVRADLQPGGRRDLNLNQKKYRSSCPSQKTGIETPISANNMPARSQNDPRLMPEMMPIGMPMKSHRIAAPTANVTVTGQAPVDLLLDRNEVPVRVVDVLVQEEAGPRDEPLGEPAVLDVERLVQAERLAGRLDLLGGGGAPHRAARRVSGRELHEDEEREQRHHEEHQDHEERPSDQVPAHLPTSSGSGLDGRGSLAATPSASCLTTALPRSLLDQPLFATAS